MLRTKENGPQKKRRPLAGRNHRSVFSKKNGIRSGDAIINRIACSVFSTDDAAFAISYFLIIVSKQSLKGIKHPLKESLKD